ncbi:MAG: lipid-A-disaccharide synthase [Pseudomonadota bacterium]
MPTIGVIAGEASGSALGAGLVRELKARRPDIRVVGVGASDMLAAGAELWTDACELSVMGLAEVLRHLPRLLRLRRHLRRRFIAEPIDLFIGIDLPDFNLSVARWLRGRGVPTMQYVSPSVWAWREKRVHGIAKAVDEVLCLLPFEPDVYAAHDVAARFVGHPLADRFDRAQTKGPARQRLGISPSARVLAVLPGSRHSEISRTADVFADAVDKVARTQSDLQVLVPVAEPSLGADVRARFGDLQAGSVRFLDQQATDAMAAADCVLLASGTATLEAMLIGRPMVVGYRLSPVTSFVLRKFNLIRIAHFSLPNLLAGSPLVPELLQEDMTADALARAVNAQLDSPDGNAAMLARFDQLRGVLANDASARAADAVLERLSP